MSRICIVADVHGNLQALEAVVADAGEADQWWSLGDVVGYGPQPNECIELLASLGSRAVSGNHDLGSVGVIGVAKFNVYARSAISWTSGVLTPGSREAMRRLPETLRPGCGAFLAHGSPRDPLWEYVLSSEQASDNFKAFHECACFTGHSHIPVVFSCSGSSEDGLARIKRSDPCHGQTYSLEEDARYLVNAGSVGQPRDGDARSCYVLFDTDIGTLTFRRVEYDLGTTQKLMETIGLHEVLVRRLAAGR